MSELIPDSELVTLRVRKIGMRRALAQCPDLADSLRVELSKAEGPFMQEMEMTLLDLKAYVYTEDLPPKTVRQTKVIHWHKTVPYEENILDGPYQRWKDRHYGSWWYPRWLLGKPRRRRLTFQVSVNDTQQVTLEVDLRRYLVYPESSLGPPRPGGPLGATVVRKHELLGTTWWTRGGPGADRVRLSEEDRS